MRTIFEKSKAEKEKDLLIEEIETNTESIKNNSKKEHQKAKNNLMLCKEQEKEKLLKGFIWMIKDKVTKLVHPDKVSLELSNGFKKLKRK